VIGRLILIILIVAASVTVGIAIGSAAH